MAHPETGAGAIFQHRTALDRPYQPAHRQPRRGAGELTIDASGNIKTYIDGTLIPVLSPATPDTTHATGKCGVALRLSWGEASNLNDYGTSQFDCGNL